MTSVSANAGLLPERVEKAAQERIAARTYQTLVFGVVDGDKSDVVAFGKLDNGKAPDGDTVYEIGSVTKTFTATLLARAVLLGRVTLDTPVAPLLRNFKIPSRDRREAVFLCSPSGHPQPLCSIPADDSLSPDSFRTGSMPTTESMGQQRTPALQRWCTLQESLSTSARSY